MTDADYKPSYDGKVASPPAVVRTAAEMGVGKESGLEGCLHSGFSSYTLKFSEPIPVPDAQKLLDDNSIAIDSVHLGNNEKLLYVLSVNRNSSLAGSFKERVEGDIESLLVYEIDGYGSIPEKLILAQNIVLDCKYSRKLQHDIQELEKETKWVISGKATTEEIKAWEKRRDEICRLTATEEYEGNTVIRQFLKAKSYGKEGNLDSAINAYESLIKNHPDHNLAVTAQYIIANSYERMGKTEKALDGYRKVLSYGNDFAPANALHEYALWKIVELTIKQNEQNKD